MKKLTICLLILVFVGLCFVQLGAEEEPKIPAMPAAVSNNAVATLQNGLEVFSLMGIGPKKNWDDVTNKAYMLRLASAKWSEIRAVPGVAGRLGAVAVGMRGKIFLFGGYIVDNQGGQITVSDVNGYVPQEKKWYRGEDIPVPVDSAVIGVNHDRYVYLVGGRSKNGPVNNVQVYDAQKNTWSQATPLPGAPVFGHAGGLADDEIVYADGAMKNSGSGDPYVVSQECWLGKIDNKDPNKIEWSKLPAHPGPAHFGIAAGALAKDRRMVFSGGSAAVHDFKGNGYDGKPVEISPVTFDLDLHNHRWETIKEDTADPRMNSRGIVETRIGRLILGGMVKDGAMTARVQVVPHK
jgi:N-acetylneuraminic acid mutarotase